MKEEVIRELDKILPVVERVHGDNHPELHTVASLYTALKENADPEKLAQLKELTSDFTAPDDACPTYIKTYADLAILAKELG